MTNDGGESVTYTLRNIPADTDRVITDLASHARKPKATFRGSVGISAITHAKEK
ncbi:TPA: hypothetical protein HID95_003226 [Escherichia coli]|nr:hypothetical protein [Escherichia coli]